MFDVSQKPQTAGRHRANATRRRRGKKQPPRWIALLAVLVVLVMVMLFTHGPRAIQNLNPLHHDLPVPHFSFALTKWIAQPTTQTSPEKLAPRAGQVADQVRRTMSTLYTDAFLNPNNWQSGSYDDVWSLFESDAAASGQQQIGAITLGPNAGSEFQMVVPHHGTLAVRVLFGANDQPATAVAIVKFQSDATSKDGATGRAIVSLGQFFLRKDRDMWRIYAFSVDRADHPMKLRTRSSGGAMPSGGSS